MGTLHLYNSIVFGLRELMMEASAIEPKDMLDKTQLELPFGLQNLGNTGYMNSTLQCLRVIPEMQESLNRFTSGSSVADKLTTSLRDLYNNLNQATESVVPLHFLQLFRSVFPQFAQNTADGFMQQDAEECWTQIISILKQANIPIPSQHSSDGEKVSSSTEESFIDHYMTGEFTSTLKCLEAPEEGEIVIKENFTKLNCHISILVNYVQHGIMMGLDEKIEKNSPTLRRMAIYDKTTRISRLPSYLTVQFVRFFWKSDRRVKSKILRKVKFPMELDATDFCTDELKNKILPLKNRLQELEKERKGSKESTQFAVNNNVQDTVTDSKNNEIVEEIKKLIDPELNKDIGANVSGLYELCAVLTHIGRSAESGNYIGWVRKENSEDWIQYDDDKVSIVSQEDILKLDGGGDWHIAYMLLRLEINM
ncbi:ubiquitin carboxyl-terminal hydrolase 14 isoform X2 [Rhizophagus irregularis DAOM 181602=DAOM 197198]|nr:ubiquitin carboxyl-terminal hydrolase 14 isoform X2 [Rhizophagus irregularis DAOM 181602=DAOM 197198]